MFELANNRRKRKWHVPLYMYSTINSRGVIEQMGELKFEVTVTSYITILVQCLVVCTFMNRKTKKLSQKLELDRS